MRLKFLALTLVAFTTGVHAWEATGRGALIELYTSEGCSSCPPADNWLSSLRSHKNLWTEVVPVAFHVDYWDGLGWPDKFASGDYTRRQRSYANLWKTTTIFTPAIIMQGENTGARQDFPKISATLSATWSNNKLVLSGAEQSEATVHVAWLAMNVLSDVNRGENAGRKLQHDFIVLRHEVLGAYKAGESISLNKPTGRAAPVKALAIWLEVKGRPVIAIGGPLSAKD